MKTMLRVFFLLLLCLPQILRAQCPAVDIGPDNINLCFGNELVLNAQNPGATFSWSTGETSQSITVVDAGKFYVVVQKDGCTVTDTINVVSVPVLWSDFTFQKVAGCMPVTYQFADNSTACESTIVAWYWEFGDGDVSTVRNPQHDFTSQASFNVKLTITDDQGNSIRRSKRVTVVPSTLSINVGADTTICFGSSVMLDAGITGATYSWSTGETTRTIHVSDDGDYIVAVNAGGCVAYDTIKINTAASVSNRWSYVKGVECLPVQVTFSDSSVAFCGQAIESWEWDFGDGSFSAEQHPVHVYTTADSFLVRLTVTTTSGSTSTATKKIGIGNTIHTVDIPAMLKVCTGEQLQIDAGVADAAYHWQPSFGVSEPHSRIVSVKPMINAWYYVDVTKCMVTVRDSIFVTVDSVVKPTIEQQANVLTASSGSSYEWYRNGHRLQGENGKTFRVDARGYYTVIVSNQSGCERMSDSTFFMPLSGKEKGTTDIKIKCSPNPSNGRLSVLLSKVPDRPAKVAVYDRYGKAMVTTFATGNVVELNLLKHAKGLYYVEISISSKKTIVPVILQ